MKTVTISQMFNHHDVQLYVHWVHLLNIGICRYTNQTPTVIYCDRDRHVIKLFNLEMDSTVSGVFLTRFGHKLLLSLSVQPDYMGK